MKKATLIKRGFWNHEATKIAALTNGTLDPLSFVSVKRWVEKCWSMPSDAELIMAAINEVMGGFGVEAIHGNYVDSYHQDIQAVYVNMGDTYNMTILHDNERGRFVATSWGDWVETHSKSRGV